MHPMDAECTNTNDYKAPMKRKRRQPVRLSSNDNDNDNDNANATANRNRNASGRSQLVAVAVANDDPLFLLQHVQQNPDVYRRVIIEMAMEEFDLESMIEINALCGNYGSSNGNGKISCSGSSRNRRRNKSSSVRHG